MPITEIKPKHTDFQGLRVLSLESRMAKPMEKLIEKFGGKPQVAASLKEVPLEENSGAFQFFEELEKGKFDLVILMTGVAIRTLIKILETRYPRERIIETLTHKTKIAVRGPKPTAVCKIHNIPIAFTAPEPNTWHEIITILSEENLLQGQRVAVLEYGIPNSAFIEELKTRGAQVTQVHVYNWALPDDLAPLKQAIEDIIAGKVDLLMFTNAAQLDHLLKVTGSVKKELALRRALAKVGIISIGPTTSGALMDQQIFPDYEAKPNKMGDMVEQAAERGWEIVQRKRARAERCWVKLSPSPQPSPVEGEGAQSLMMRACRREKNDRIPVWFLRQAGRYMAEYQLVRKGIDFLDFCKNSDLAAEATLTAVERLGVDAAIIFADILLIVEPMGVPLAYKEGEGPVIGVPVRTVEDIEKLTNVEVKESLGFVLEAIRKVRRSMHPRIPLIGFCGAPFTVASYMIEGRGSRNFIPTKTLMHEQPKAWHGLMEKLTTASIDYLKAQVEAGCQILQVFDSWVGWLSPNDYQNFVLPHMKRLFSELPQNIPAIHFGTGNPALLKFQKEAGGNVIGLDWRVDISKAWNELGEVAVQGNLDPVLLFSNPEIIFEEARRILESVGSRPGFIFNVGHGILPETPVDHVMALVDFIHDWNPQ
jgi:uroporphyrinogen decarboxylase